MNKKNILLIDDDADFLRALTIRCENIGLVVEQTRNLLTATLLTAKRVPDIICVDVQMPTGNGLSFCNVLATEPTTSHVPMVVLTGKTDLETIEACKPLRAFYVEKVVDYWSTLEPILRQLAAETPKEIPKPINEPFFKNVPAALLQPVSPTETPDDSAQRDIRKRILIADDDADIVKMLSRRCRTLGCSVIGVNNALDAINEIHGRTPDLVCLDIGMPRGDGLSVCELMASDERLRKVPVIILTGKSDEVTIRRCHNLLAYYVEKNAHTWERVEPLVRDLLHLDAPAAATTPAISKRPAAVVPEEAKHEVNEHLELMDAVFAALGSGAHDEHEGEISGESSSMSPDLEQIPWVLCIDDDADFTDALKIRLEDHGVAVIRAYSGLEGYRLAFTAPASAILLDFNMPNGQGDYILGRLKDNPVTKDIPVVVITGTRDKMLERRMLAMGATAFFEKPVSFDQLREHLSKYIDILSLSKESPVKDTHGQKVRRIMQHISEPG